jgi:hypothetical protein
VQATRDRLSRVAVGALQAAIELIVRALGAGGPVIEEIAQNDFGSAAELVPEAAELVFIHGVRPFCVDIALQNKATVVPLCA